MEANTLVAGLAALTADLRPIAGTANSDLSRLKNELAASLIAQSPDEIRTGIIPSAANKISMLSVSHLGQLVQIANATIHDAARNQSETVYSSFERTVPVISPLLDNSVPEWARGAAVDHTLGPFMGSDGIQKWFDFYARTKKQQVKIFITDPAHPVLVLTIIEPVFFPANRTSYQLPKGSAWIVAAGLSSGISNTDAYAGLKIISGQIVFSKMPTPAGNDFQIDNTTKITLTLVPDPVTVTDADPIAGLDASEAVPEYFSSVVFECSAGIVKLVKATMAKLSAYGAELMLDQIDETATVSYLTETGGIFIPFKSSTENFSFSAVHSVLWQITGTSKVLEAGWLLPVSLIAASGLGEAAGTGDLGFAGTMTGKINWAGLAGGGISIEKILLLVSPGLINIILLSTKNPLASQKVNLWQEDIVKKRFSSAAIFFTKSAELKYISSATGIEIINAITNASIDVDRPITAAGTRLRILPVKANFSLIQVKSVLEILLFDAALLSEFSEVELFTIAPRVPLALRNAFFISSQPEAFMLAGPLSPKDQSVSKGTLGVLFGIFDMFLTLPDPYVTNQPLFWNRQQYAADQNNRKLATTGTKKLLELMSFVNWPDQQGPVLDFKLAPVSEQSFSDFLKTFVAEDLKNQIPADPANPVPVEAPLTVDSFQALPLSQQFKRLFASSGISKEIAAGGIIVADNRPEPVRANEAIKKAYGDLYEQMLSSVLSQGQLLLLDVSGNADQLGIGFNYSPGFRNAGQDNLSLSQNFPFQAQGMDIISSGKYVRAFTLPQIQWEPVKNIPNPNADPPTFPNPVIFPNDGGPTTLMSANTEMVALEPRQVIRFIENSFNDKNKPQPAAAYFTLPFGMVALSFLHGKKIANFPYAAMEFNQPEFRSGPKVSADVEGGIQLKTTSLRSAPAPKLQDPYFYGYAMDTPNLGNQVITVYHHPDPPVMANVPYGMLGAVVGFAFNREFYSDATSRVPLRRIDFSGYGASIFSEWLNLDADFGMTSQAKFNVLIGRTAHEVVQIKSIIYPWGVPVVRTITIQRANNARVTRYDSGWQSQGPGVYDFSYTDQNGVPVPGFYLFHPGIVRGIYNVREIKDTGQLIDMGGGAIMEAVWFDCDANIDFVVQGAVMKNTDNGIPMPLVPSRKQLGFVLLADPANPAPLSTNTFRDFIKTQTGPIGGPVDCVVNIGGSGQLMRVSRIDVDVAVQPSPADPLFVTSARGTVVLPNDGAWSVVIHNIANDQVAPVDVFQSIPLIRFGQLDVEHQVIPDDPGNLYRIANPEDISALANPINEFGFLQTTGTQKLLFRQPGLQKGVKELQTLTPTIADAYRIVNSKSVFPNVRDTINLPSDADIAKLDIIEKGLKFKDSIINKLTDFVPAIPNAGRFDIINTPAFKIYILYSNPADSSASTMSVDLNSDPAAGRKNWASITKNVSMVVDLGIFSPLLTVTGDFNASFGESPGFSNPKIVLNDALQKIKDILELIATLSLDPDYLEILKEGMQIGMSNSADSWDYKLHAVQEIPVLKFPSLAIEDAGPPPLKLQASLSLGFYFNETMKPSNGTTSLLPASGAFVQFFGQLSVMVLSLEVATVYAIGTTVLRVSTDTSDPVPVLDFTFGFGAEIVIQLPVIARVSVSFLVMIGIKVQSGPPTITAGFIYKGVADILDGLVVVTIFIEAHGSITPRAIGEGTSIQADVTFGLDISIFLVIDINFTKTWSETRRIA